MLGDSGQALRLWPLGQLAVVVAVGLLTGLGLWLLGLPAPLTVLLTMAVARLCVRDALDTPVRVPGEGSGQQPPSG